MNALVAGIGSSHIGGYPRSGPAHIFQVAAGAGAIRASLIGKLMSAAAAARAISAYHIH
jgi:hypothetical protein